MFQQLVEGLNDMLVSLFVIVMFCFMAAMFFMAHIIEKLSFSYTKIAKKKNICRKERKGDNDEWYAKLPRL